jgi:hypothetical protein
MSYCITRICINCGSYGWVTDSPPPPLNKEGGQSSWLCGICVRALHGLDEWNQPLRTANSLSENVLPGPSSQVASGPALTPGGR